jgi:two-component system, OmpR family, response regulator
MSDECKKAGQIIVVDDDAAIRRMMTCYFKEQNIAVGAASNRTELHCQIARSYPIAIILDLQLGSDDGLDLLREIRSRSDVPVIIMTGHRLDESDRIVCLELGADDYIVKQSA